MSKTQATFKIDFMEISRESIFTSGLRSFCNALMGSIGALIGIAIIIFLFAFAFSGPHVDLSQTTVTIEADGHGQRKLLPDSTPVILKINLQGVVGMRGFTSEDIQRQLDDSQGFALRAGRVKGLFLAINSPGGSAIDSENIYHLIAAYKKKYNVPVYAYVDGMCASGAMYAACAGDKILTTPASIIGSVGVILGPNFNVSDLMQKLGIKEITLTEGKDKDALNPFRPWKDNEEDNLKEITSYLYDRFVATVAQNRPQLTEDKLKNDYGARIFAAAKAQSFGYVDESESDYKSALTELVQAAKIDGAYQVVSLEPQKQLLKEFINNQSPLISGKIRHQFFEEPTSLKDPILYLYQP